MKCLLFVLLVVISGCAEMEEDEPPYIVSTDPPMGDYRPGQLGDAYFPRLIRVKREIPQIIVVNFSSPPKKLSLPSSPRYAGDYRLEGAQLTMAVYCAYQPPTGSRRSRCLGTAAKHFFMYGAHCDQANE